MQSKARTVSKYLAELPAERRQALRVIRATILENLPAGYEEGMQYGMIGYFVPHGVYPAGYHCDPKQPLPFAALASQKNYISIYMMCIYGSRQHEKWFREAWAKTGKKLDMGKSCVRVRKLDDLPLELIGQAIGRVPVKRFIEYYESAIKGGGRKRAGQNKTSATKPRRKQRSATKTAVKKKMAPRRAATSR